MLTFAELDFAAVLVSPLRSAIQSRGAAHPDSFRLAADALHAEFADFNRFAPREERALCANSNRRVNCAAMAMIFPGIN